MSIEAQNKRILTAVDAVGGSYVWDAEVIYHNIDGCFPTEELALSLCGLIGVQQIAIEASTLQMDTLVRLAGTAGLSSLVLNHSCLTDEEVAQLSSIVPELIQVDC
jgi:hypothetical protein